MANDYENGVWRTVGGRRIFIRDGEDLASAMKKSGKFTSKKNINQMSIRNNEGKVEKLDMNEVKKIEDAGNNYDIEMKDGRMSVSKDKVVSINGKEIEKEKDKKASKDINQMSEEEFEKYYDEEQRKFQQTFADRINNGEDEQKVLREAAEHGFHPLDVRNVAERLKEKESSKDDQVMSQKEYDKLMRDSGMYEKHKGENVSYDDYVRATKDAGVEEINRSIREQVAESSKGALKEMRESEVRSQQADIEKASGMKVKDAFQTDLYGNGKENRFILEDGTIVGHTLESFGQKTDDWYVGDKRFKNYDEVKDYLSRSGDETNQAREFLKRNKSIEEAEEGYKWGERAIHEYNNASRAEKQNIKQFANEKIRNRNKAYEKAFDEYKKKHPNTRLSLREFMNISEGK